MARSRTTSPGSPPGEAADVLVRIRAKLPDLAPAERRVAAVALEDPAATSARTISQLASACLTSEATVVRFCRAIGMHGYPELRLALASAAGKAETGGGYVSGEIEVGDSDDVIIQKIARADASAITDTASQIDAAALGAAADALRAAGRIDVYGAGASAFVAADLQQKLQRIGVHATTTADPHVAIAHAALLGPRDAAVSMSHTGTTRDTLDFQRTCTAAGATTVALTNFPTSALAREADHVLTTAARETTFRSGAMASRIAQLTVVDMLFVAVAQRSHRRAFAALEKTYEAVRGRHDR